MNVPLTPLSFSLWLCVARCWEEEAPVGPEDIVIIVVIIHSAIISGLVRGSQDSHGGTVITPCFVCSFKLPQFRVRSATRRTISHSVTELIIRSCKLSQFDVSWCSQMWSTHPPLPPTDILLGLPLLPPPAPRHVLLMVTRTKPTGGDVNSLIAQ